MKKYQLYIYDGVEFLDEVLSVESDSPFGSLNIGERLIAKSNESAVRRIDGEIAIIENDVFESSEGVTVHQKRIGLINTTLFDANHDED